MKTETVKRDNGTEFVCGGKTAAFLPSARGASDEITPVMDGVWHVSRIYDEPVTDAELRLDTRFKPEYWMVPAVSYNGNGWGETKEYRGARDAESGQLWTFAWHRTAVPAATISESGGFCACLCAARQDASCSIDPGESGASHYLVWPEQEGPRLLWDTQMMPPFKAEGEPRREFEGFVMLFPVDRPKTGYHRALDAAWKLFAHPVKPWMSDEQLRKYGVAYAKTLYTVEPDGFAGFSIGLRWDAKACLYVKREDLLYESGWCGQNASLANSLLCEYINNGDEDARDKALSVLDCLVERSALPNGMIYSSQHGCADGVTRPNETIDACNLGTTARQLYKASELMEKLGDAARAEKYKKAALGVCTFALGHQRVDGAFAKSWDKDGNITRSDGTVGAFLIPPLVIAHEKTGDRRYLTAAERAFDKYFAELRDNGYTTAGALDTVCADKESTMPLLAAALSLYESTRDGKYLSAAVDAAWYLSSWQWHYSTKFPKGSHIEKLGYDTMGATAVSTSHNHLDPYAVLYVNSLKKLAALTGESQWERRANAIWQNASQLVSDGTMTVHGQTRPAGGQDEGVMHTRFAWPGGECFDVSRWLVAWPTAFRLESLRERRGY